MPTYQYRCENCGHELEQFQSIKAEPLTECPECHAPSLKRLMGTGGAFIFKGSGFYITDYRSESYKQAAKADAEKSSSSSSKSSASSTTSNATPAATTASNSGSSSQTGSSSSS